MNTFIEKSNPVASFLLRKGSGITADSLEAEVEKKYITSEQTNLLIWYIFIIWLTRNSHIHAAFLMYYTQAKQMVKRRRDVKSAAFRFVHLKDGQDCKQNITLGRYYKKGKTIGLDIYEVDDCKKKEKELRYRFLNEYGALPIADGAAYSNDKFFIKSVDEKIDEGID